MGGGIGDWDIGEEELGNGDWAIGDWEAILVGVQQNGLRPWQSFKKLRPHEDRPLPIGRGLVDNRAGAARRF
jgi:hypothetical protein